MITRELIGFIVKERGSGKTNDQIKNVLVQNGWLPSDVEEGFRHIDVVSYVKPIPDSPISHLPNPRPGETFYSVNQPLVGSSQSYQPRKKGHKALLFLILLLLIGGSASAYYFREDLRNFPIIEDLFPPERTQLFFPEESADDIDETNWSIDLDTDLNTNTNTNITDVILPTQTNTQTTIVFSDPLANNLYSCTLFKTQFTHPSTKENFTREILGIVGGECIYREELPAGGKMECSYTESERRVMAKYYSDVAGVEAAGFSSELDSSSTPKTTYTMNGKVVENPLAEAIRTGACVISGY